MSILKITPGFEIRPGKHGGQCFQESNQGPTIKNNNHGRSTRGVRQISKKAFLLNAVTRWRNLSPTIQTAWATFAAAFPQPTKKDPTKFLTGYQNFIKRATYLFLNYGLDQAFDEPPTMESILPETVSFSVTSGSNCVDCTEAYIANFGMLPSTGDFLLLKVLPMATHSGQWFPPFEALILCQEVFIDGLFLSLSFPNPHENMLYSIFLSRPQKSSIIFQSTKTRYMGCFTAKKFTELTDCPSSYVGQALKLPRVKANETGLEFITAPSGGLTCSDLPACAKIISMDALSLSIIDSAIAAKLFSWPFLKFSLLYNFFTSLDGHQLFPVGWRLPTIAEWTALSTALGGDSVSGGKLREFDYQYASSPNTGASNSALFNGRLSGIRSGSDGSFSGFRTSLNYMSSSVFNATYINSPNMGNSSAALSISGSIAEKTRGISIRAVRPVSDNIFTFTGNNGIKYRTITIGNLVWLADNLAETLFRDGTPIPYVSDNTAWKNLLTAGYCLVNNSAANT